MSGADQAAAEGMGTDVEEIDKVITQFLAFAKGEDEAQLEGDLAALISAIADGYRKREQDIFFKPGNGLSLRFAPTALRRALVNLIDNALRYAGGQVEIAARREGGGLNARLILPA